MAYPITENTLFYRREDGSFVLDNIYHVPNFGEWAELWAELQAQYEKTPGKFIPAPSDPESPESDHLPL